MDKSLDEYAKENKIGGRRRGRGGRFNMDKTNSNNNTNNNSNPRRSGGGVQKRRPRAGPYRSNAVCQCFLFFKG